MDRSRRFISFYFMQWRPNVSNTEGKVMILLSTVFRRLLNSFNVIFRQETLTALKRKTHKLISRHSTCLFTFYRQNIFLPTANDQKFFGIVSEMRNEKGILSFVHWKL